MTAVRAVPFLRRCLAHLGDETTAHDDGTLLGTVTLFPHQVSGARRLHDIIESYGGALLADEVGLGKTFTALQVARHAPTVLIVAPAVLRDMWQRALDHCGVAADIVSYERLSAGRIDARPRWSLVMLDEAHHARTPTTRRYRALETITRGARVLLITATPIHNRRRDLQALFALFLGAGASTLDDATVSALIVRRRVDDVRRPFPVLAPLVRHALPRADAVLEALRALPPPLPPADGGVAQALVALQLTRAWCSSDAALLAAIRRRLVTAVALEQSLECGRRPSRRDLVSWTAASDGSVQLAFPQLVAAPAREASVGDSLATVRAHAAALRVVRALVRGHAGRDGARYAVLRRLLEARRGRQVVIFTHSAETAEAAFATLRRSARIALLTGRGAALASGPVARRDVLDQFAPTDDRTRPNSGRPVAEAARIDVLVASDVASEGIDLQRAAVVVHLDLPWTVARLEQRMGRVRRIGSCHAKVEAHFVAPPVGAHELDATLRHLMRKAAVAGATIGSSSVLGDAEQWAELLPATAHSAPATARNGIRDVLRRLEALARREAGRVVTSGASSATAADASPATVVRWPVLRRAPPCTVALVSIAGCAHLVVATRLRGVSHDPAVVLAVLEAAQAAICAAEKGRACAPGDLVTRDETTDRPCDCACDCACDRAFDCAFDRACDRARQSACASENAAASDSTTTTELEHRVRQWCRARAAAGAVVPPTARNSPSHRRLLHLLDALPSCAPRAQRARVATAVAEARAFAVRQQGAGVERLLDTLSTSHPPAGAGAEQREHWLVEVVRTLRPAPGDERAAAPQDDHPSGVVLHGMLTLHRAC
ncbi:MAG: DEAD/DEAH box helicase [Gemmatimonadetes bacterium]|nr:DEAD/DEAH box helicase [Gemmatimonadota bacterium]